MRRVSSFLLVLLAALLGGACLFQLTEQDIFWQLRAGDELWRTGVFVTADTWTYTAFGAPWRNFEWLSTLLVRGLFALGGVPGLVLARGCIVAGICGVWIACARRAGASKPWAALLCGLAWVACLPRLQLRPELFVLAAYAGLFYLWLGPSSAARKRWGSMGLVLLSANLHPGLACFVSLVAASFLLQKPTRANAAGALACCAGPLLTPYGLHSLHFIWDHLVYFNQGVLPNPEHRRWSLDYLFSAAGMATLVLFALAFWAWVRGPSLPAYRQRLPAVLTALLLAAVCVERVRAIPFACAFALPLAASLPLASTRLRSLVLWTSTAAWALASVRTVAPSWGFGLDERLTPVGAANFLAANSPRGRLFHNFSDGAYLVWALRDRPLFVDTRETLFWQLEFTLRDAFASADAMQALVEHYHIDSVLLPIPSEGPGRLGQIFPALRWGLVYRDATHFVLTRQGATSP